MQLRQLRQKLTDRFLNPVDVLSLQQHFIILVQLPHLRKGQLKILRQLPDCRIGQNSFILQRLVDGGALYSERLRHPGYGFPPLVKQLLKINGKLRHMLLSSLII